MSHRISEVQIRRHGAPVEPGILRQPFPVLKELEDCDWFPGYLRRFQTDFIGFAVAKMNVYDEVAAVIDTSSATQMVDLCSGSGEPAITVFRKCENFTHLTMTDKFPSKKIDDEQISYCNESLDVRKMKFHPGMCYTMFNAFHHFSNSEKLNFVDKIRDSGSTAVIVELLEPKLFCMLKVILAGTIGSLLAAPFVKPFSFARLFFTWIVPLNILTITIDGVISVIKSKSANQYRKLFSAHAGTVDISMINKFLLPVVIIQIRPGK